MPRRSQKAPDDRDQWRDLFVSRLTEDQQREGWSDSQVAYQASVYVPMTGATIWKMKNSEPARRIDIDEARAVMLAFGYESFDEFLKSNDVGSRIRRLTVEATESFQRTSTGNAQVENVIHRIAELIAANPSYDEEDLVHLEPLIEEAKEQRQRLREIFAALNSMRKGERPQFDQKSGDGRGLEIH